MSSSRSRAPSSSKLHKFLSAGLLLALLCALMPLSASAGGTDDVHAGEVRRLYLAFFDREPDVGGAAYWQGRRRAGVSLPAIADRFARSPEFVGQYGSVNDDDYVALVYHNVLEREPDPSGLTYWRARMREGMGRGSLMAHFSESREFRSATSLSGTSSSSRRGQSPPDGRGQGPSAEPAPGGGGGSGGSGGSGGEEDTTSAPDTTTTTTTTTTAPPATTTTTTTAPPSPSDSYDDVPTNVDTGNWLMAPWEPNPSDMSWEPSGAFRTFCHFSHVGYADPIVDPGNDRFMHLHMFFGNTGADHGSTYQSLRSGGSGTCDGGPLNRTAYWMPAVFDVEGGVVVPDIFELYYKGENTSSGTIVEKQNEIGDIQPYPNGLRMIAGAMGPGGQPGLTWGWKCGGGSSSATIPDCAPGERLTAWVRFPYCWDGENLDSADHRSHMAYGTNNTWGGCPSTHPIHLPELTEFAHFNSPSGSSNWYLSSDRMGETQPNGSTFHADWFGAWDNAIQDRWLDGCIRGMRSGSNGNLCDGEQLRPAPSYSGPSRLTGWQPMP